MSLNNTGGGHYPLGTGGVSASPNPKVDTTNNGWNYRVIILREPDIVNKGEYVDSYSFRDVYYKNGVPTSWGSEPQPAVGENIEFLIGDITLMAEALQKPPILIQNDKIQGELSYSSQDQTLITRFLDPYKKAMKIADDSSENIKKMFEKMMYEKKITPDGGLTAGQVYTTTDSANYPAPIDLSYGQRQYLIEEKKRELQHEIDKARMLNNTAQEQALIQAYEKFQKQVYDDAMRSKKYEF